MRDRQELAQILREEVLNIWEVAEATGMAKSSIHTYLLRPTSDFPRPIYESSPTDLSGSSKRHPTRLWSKSEVDDWVLAKQKKGRSPNK